MKMTFRWYGSENDQITLEDIRQIPGMSGVVPAIWDEPVGAAWPEEKIKAMVEEIHAAGLEAEIVESVNIHDDIKIGLPSRDEYIENYKTTIRRLSKYGVKAICYNFMPVFDWLRTDLAMKLEDGSTALAYVRDLVPESAEEMVKQMEDGANGKVLPGWEPERLANVKELFAKYEGVDDKKLFDNLVYFLEAIMPTCEECDVKMAIHPDDPPYSLFGLPRIVNDRDNIKALLDAVDTPYNGLTFCTGSLGSKPTNDLPAMIREFTGRIVFAHVRNIKFMNEAKTDFHESSHLSADGDVDMYEVLKALYETGFDGYMRPDHGRAIWHHIAEIGNPGYSLFDRALGAMYLNSMWETLTKDDERGVAHFGNLAK
ncbi:MAG: mannonate dehydratase [Lactobacillales bacterium]|jgi:mannonate dehydratase|nr:mannonate dehydratase [Lactobacillales bacterium]